MKPRNDSQESRSSLKDASSLTQPQNAFSPIGTTGGGMSNFFNSRGPIRPPQIIINASDGQNSQGANQKVIIPQARDFIRDGAEVNYIEQSSSNNYQHQQQQQQQQQRQYDDEFYGEEDDDEYGDEGDGEGMGMMRQLDPIEEQKLILSLQKAGQNNLEFLKVLNILQKDEELKPLIYEHQTLLFQLKDMIDVKAEQMLSILTAAESEMLLQQALRRPQTDAKEISVNIAAVQSENDQEKENLLLKSQTAIFESEKLRKEIQRLEQEKLSLTHELSREKELRENLEKEKECTFKNLYDENQLLKKLNETLKKNETETKKVLEKREQEFQEEIENLLSKLRNQEELRISMLQNRSKLEVDIKRNQQFIENLEKEIQLLEKENDNLHRKMNSTYNSILFQSQIHPNQLIMGALKGTTGAADQVVNISDDNNSSNTPARRNLSSSFQNSASVFGGLILDKKDSTNNNIANNNNNINIISNNGYFIGQPIFGQSTQRLKMLMSENNNNRSLQGGNQSFIAHSIYYGLGGFGANKDKDSNSNNIYFHKNDTLVRSNSIDVILLDDEESKKQNMYVLGEEEKQPSNASGVFKHQSWFKTKGLFTDLSPINSISSSHQQQHEGYHDDHDVIGDSSSSKIHHKNQQQQQRLKKLQEVEEEQTEILGTYPGTSTNMQYNVKYYEEQVKKLQQEIERLKDENKELTMRMAAGTTNQGGIFMVNNRTNNTQAEQESPANQSSTSEKNLMMVYATPQNNNTSSNFISKYQRGIENTHQTGAEPLSNYQRQILHTNNINPMFSNEQSPMMMATFSKEKEKHNNQHHHFYSQYTNNNNNIMNSEAMLAAPGSILNQNNHNFDSQHSMPKTTSDQDRQRIVEEYNEKIQYEFSSKIQEIGHKLIGLFKRFSPFQNEVQHYLRQEFNISLIKEIIHDITNRLDYLFDLQQQSSVGGGPIRSGGSVLMSHPQISQISPPYGTYFPQSMGNIPLFNINHGSYGGVPLWAAGGVSHNNSTTMDQTPVPPLDLKNMLLEEKEKRLQIQEELHKTKENVLKYQNENERLKLELQHNEKHKDQTMVMSNLALEQHSQNVENLMRQINILQNKCESLQDENLSLKLKISELEGELLDERQKQQNKYEYNIENLKNNMFSQYFDNKIRFEEQLMTLKEEKFKLTTEIQALLERNQILKEQLMIFRDRITELEKDNLVHSKENYILQNELDYETLRASQLQSKRLDNKNNQILTQQVNIDRVRYEEIMAKLEVRLKDLQYQSSEWQLKANKAEDMNKLSKMRFEDEIYRLKSDNTRILEELKSYQEINKKSTASFCQDNNSQSRMIESYEKKMAALKVNLILQKRAAQQKIKAFYRWFLINIWIKNCNNSLSKRLNENDQSNISFNMIGESSYGKFQQMEEQLYKLQTLNQSLTMLVGKVLKSINLRKPVKANFSGLANKQTLDYILYGLKNNSQVYDLNLSKNQLDDEDLQKLCDLLKFDQGIQNLKLSHNKFTNLQSLLDLLLVKRYQLKQLDISYCSLNIQNLDRLPSVLSQIQSIEELSLCSMIDQQLSQSKDKINNFIDSLLQLPRLKALDLSKNKFQDDSLNYLLNNLKNLAGLESLAISSIGIKDVNSSSLIGLITNQKNLKRLNVSGNSSLSALSVERMIIALQQKGIIEDLNLSKCQVSQQSCLQAIANLLMSNRNIRQLMLQRVSLTDANAYYLIEPLSECLNIETLRLDFNKIGPTFVEKLTKKMVVNQIKSPQINRASGLSGMTEESETSISYPHEDDDNNFQSNLFTQVKSKQSQSQSQNQGLLYLSFEGNPIGDRGAKAFSDLIKIPNENSKRLKSINLNECGITNIGYEELKLALMERGNLALNANLSHVKISIERNNINY